MPDAYWYTWFPGSLLAVAGLLALCYRGIEAFIKIKNAADKIATIEHEFQPNSGKSMRDQVNALRAEQITVSKTLVIETERRQSADRRIADHMAEDKRSFDKIDASLDRIEDHILNGK